MGVLLFSVVSTFGRETIQVENTSSSSVRERKKKRREMGSSDETSMAVQDISESSTFPEAAVERESNPGQDKNLEIDPISSQVATSLEIKEAAIEAEQREREVPRKEALQTLKTTVFVSAAVVAVAGAIFAIAKKLREK